MHKGSEPTLDDHEDDSEDYEDLYDDDNSSSEASNRFSSILQRSSLYRGDSPHSPSSAQQMTLHSSSRYSYATDSLTNAGVGGSSATSSSILANNNSGGGGGYYTSFGRNMESNKRDHHNRLERKRRASIKDCFNDLRSVLPGIMGRKPSRAVILQKAAKELHDTDVDNAQMLRSIRWYTTQAEDLNARTARMQRTLDALQARMQFGYDDDDEEDEMIENDEEQENHHLEGCSSSGNSGSYDFS